MVGIMLVSLFILLLLMGLPIAFVIAIVTLIGFFTIPNLPEIVLTTQMFHGLNSFVLLAVPLYILTANIMNAGKISQVLIDFALSIVGHIRGGLAQSNVLVSMMFAGVSGAATADTASVGKILIPNMIRAGYDKNISVGVTAASSTIGVLIPPSIPMIIFAGLTGTSVTTLFLAGIVPGVLVGIGMMLVIYFISVKNGYPQTERTRINEVFKLFFRSVPALLTPVIIIGGIMTGWYTSTEAAAFASVYALIISMFFFKTIKFKDIPEILVETLKLSSLSLFALATASALGKLLSYYQIHTLALEFFSDFVSIKILFVITIILFFLFIGAFMDMIPAMILFVPILYPVVMSFGISPELFGLITVITLAVGLVTPPYGLCLLIASSIADLSIGRSFKAVLPFIVVIIAVLLFVVAFPKVSFFIPDFLGR